MHFLKILFIFREEREKEMERNIHMQGINQLVASHAPPTGDLASNPGMWPDWESNLKPFGLQAGTQSTETQQPGLTYAFFLHYLNKETEVWKR